MEHRFPSCPPQAPTSNLGLEGGGALGRAHGVLSAPSPAINRLETVLNNLALTASNNTAVLQHLMAANLALTTLITMLTATNKR